MTVSDTSRTSQESATASPLPRDRVVLLAKDHGWGRSAAAWLRALFPCAETHLAPVGTPFPTALVDAPRSPQAVGARQILLSFLSPWIVPAEVLARFDLALNFHPGPREYPGTGCYNFALYEGAREYGCVVHHMHARVDSGPIVAERRFPVAADETVETLQLKTLAVMLGLFGEILAILAAGAALPQAAQGWTRPAFRRRQLEELCRITPHMAAEERRRRLRATDYPGFLNAYIDLADGRYHYGLRPGPALAMRPDVAPEPRLPPDGMPDHAEMGTDSEKD